MPKEFPGVFFKIWDLYLSQTEVDPETLTTEYLIRNNDLFLETDSNTIVAIKVDTQNFLPYKCTFISEKLKRCVLIDSIRKILQSFKFCFKKRTQDRFVIFSDKFLRKF